MRHLGSIRGIAASLCLHMAVLAALIALPGIDALQPVSEESIDVELVTPEQAGARPAPVGPLAAERPSPQQPPPPVASETPVTPPPAVAASDPAPPQSSDPNAMITAQRLLSESVLAGPRSRQAREALKSVEVTERIEQLCNLEAMSQIHAWQAAFAPDRVVAYAMAGVRLSKTVLEADGAAFRSHRQWYGLRFRCEVTANGARVAGFRFRVGDPVPRDEWAAHDLPPIH